VEDRVLEIVGLDSESGLIMGDWCPRGSRHEGRGARKKRPPAGGRGFYCWSRWETYWYVVVGRLTSFWCLWVLWLDVFLPWAKTGGAKTAP